MHEAYDASPILKLTVQIESMAAYGKLSIHNLYYYFKVDIIIYIFIIYVNR